MYLPFHSDCGYLPGIKSFNSEFDESRNAESCSSLAIEKEPTAKIVTRKQIGIITERITTISIPSTKDKPLIRHQFPVLSQNNSLEIISQFSHYLWLNLDRFCPPGIAFGIEFITRFASSLRSIIDRDLGSQKAFNVAILRISREIRPFVRVDAVVVQFFGIVRIPNVSPILRTDGMIASAVRD